MQKRNPPSTPSQITNNYITQRFNSRISANTKLLTILPGRLVARCGRVAGAADHILPRTTTLAVIDADVGRHAGATGYVALYSEVWLFVHIVPLVSRQHMLTTQQPPVNVYEGVEECSPEARTKYRIISGASDQQCYNFAQAPDMWANCAQYGSGALSPQPCDKKALTPQSVRIKNNLTGRDHACEVYDEPDCPGESSNVVYNGCFTGWSPLRSFKCHV